MKVGQNAIYSTMQIGQNLSPNKCKCDKTMVFKERHGQNANVIKYKMQ